MASVDRQPRSAQLLSRSPHLGLLMLGGTDGAANTSVDLVTGGGRGGAAPATTPTVQGRASATTSCPPSPRAGAGAWRGCCGRGGCCSTAGAGTGRAARWPPAGSCGVGVAAGRRAPPCPAPRCWRPRSVCAAAGEVQLRRAGGGRQQAVRGGRAGPGRRPGHAPGLRWRHLDLVPGAGEQQQQAGRGWAEDHRVSMQSLHSARYGACAVAHRDYVLVVGGAR